MKKVFISTSTFGEDDPSILDALSKGGAIVTMNPFHRRLSQEEITGILVKGEYDGLLAGLEPLTKDVLAKAQKLRVISRIGVGVDNVDLIAARKLGIKVFNTPGVLTDAVAELTLGLILAALRKIVFSDRQIRQGVWDKKMGCLFKGKTLGVVGLGDIGECVARLALAFSVKVIFSDVRKIKKAGVKQVALKELIKSADIISLHCSGQKCLIGKKEIEAAKRGVIIINTARGHLVDEKVLLRGLLSGKIAAAGLDVFQEEPYQGDLLKQDNVVLTPHLGSYARESRVIMERMAVKNLLTALGKR